MASLYTCTLSAQYCNASPRVRELRITKSMGVTIFESERELASRIPKSAQSSSAAAVSNSRTIER